MPSAKSPRVAQWGSVPLAHWKFHMQIAKQFVRHVSRLSKSAEAIRQTQMGIALDPSRPVAEPVPIMEEIFDDEHIFARDLDELKKPFVTPQTPFAQCAQELKGSAAPAVNALFAWQLITTCRTRLVIPDQATLYYFPAWHAVAQFRKSRPAITIVQNSGLEYNGNEPELLCGQKISKKAKAQKPLDKAVWRQTTSRKFRRALFDEMSKRTVPDGLYVIMARRVPSNEEAAAMMGQFIDSVASADLSWATRFPKTLKANYRKLEQALLQKKVEPPQLFLDRNAWL